MKHPEFKYTLRKQQFTNLNELQKLERLTQLRLVLNHKGEFSIPGAWSLSDKVVCFNSDLINLEGNNKTFLMAIIEFNPEVKHYMLYEMTLNYSKSQNEPNFSRA